MANNAILFRQEHIAPIRQAVKDFFAGTQWGSYQAYVNYTREDYRPIRIRDDVTGRRYVLPLTIKDNPRFAKLKEIIEEATSGVTLIQVIKADLPEEFVDGSSTDYSIPA